MKDRKEEAQAKARTSDKVYYVNLRLSELFCCKEK